MSAQNETAKAFLVCLLGFSVLALTACSYSTNFVVVNASNNPIEVRYTLNPPVNPVAPSRLAEVPSVKPISQLDRQIPWQELPTTRFTFDPSTRTAVISLMPGEGLRVEQRKLENDTANNGEQAASFSIEEIDIGVRMVKSN